jgi:hypothetical protein
MLYTIASSYSFSLTFSFNKGPSIALVRPKAAEGLEGLHFFISLEKKNKCWKKKNKCLRQGSNYSSLGLQTGALDH